MVNAAKCYWTIPVHIVKINTTNNSIISTLSFAENIHPSLMTYSDGTLYYQVSGKIYSMTDSATSLPTESIINASFSGMAVNNNIFYGVDAKDNVTQGSLNIYDLTTKTEIKSVDLGIIPSKIYFN